MRTHWAGIKEHVGAYDEVDMSTTRLRLRLPDEEVPDTPQLNILEKSEVISFYYLFMYKVKVLFIIASPLLNGPTISDF